MNSGTQEGEECARRKGPLVQPLHSHVPKFSISLFLLKPATETMIMITQAAGLSLRAGGQGFSPATKRVAPGYFYWKIEEK